ncbi:carboxyl-terminal peptidase, partial [Trifolium medium]|nr:carboxyl-terminal peptidase [Trifolium medium]
MQNRSSYGKTMNKCPEGKVPIYNKTGRHQIITNSSSKLQVDDFQQYSQSAPGYHTVTLDTTQNMIFHGAHAGIAGYGLSLDANQYSISSIWIESGPPIELNSIKVGLGADGYKKTGCFNNRCSGYVQVDRNKGLGSPVSPLNSIGSTEKLSTFIKIKQ